MSLTNVLDQIQGVLADPASGIAVSLNEPPENLGALFPVSILNPTGGAFQPSATDKLATYQIEVIVYVTPRRADLPHEFAQIAPLVNSVEQTIWTAYLNDTFVDPVTKCWVDSWSQGIRLWGSQPFHTVTFVLGAIERNPGETP